MRFWSWLRGEPRCEYYYKKRLEKIQYQIRYDTPRDQIKKWINEYNEEETLGFAILQRQRRLENEKQMAGAQQQQQQFRRRQCKQCQYQKEICSACHEAMQRADVPPPYLSRCPEDLERNLAKLREELWKSRARLEAISQKLTDSRSWWALYAMVPRWRRNDAGRTFKWVEGRMSCADRGGCCGRTCGCCEEVLLEYQRPKWRDSGKTHVSHEERTLRRRKVVAIADHN
ncbi:hypothetical protein AtubIFM56815_011288 [Aspergillus tubingensis]|uniref:Uncharacterized protein n=1 Tax=Aspergillus tubingensis TaxID=5068 RepID=A0A9W6AT21_ASPTU|nr:hypothetical protein AtubIFM54640_005452 [Aspergillus tubingensis]GLA87017.1 hypothetical protein AtubIFM56815_011288 [Aspergillus tubingensis]GLA97980.1 hypothetical protein AtubIFM57143_005913 [Aspergillus tubingensis]